MGTPRELPAINRALLRPKDQDLDSGKWLDLLIERQKMIKPFLSEMTLPRLGQIDFVYNEEGMYHTSLSEHTPEYIGCDAETQGIFWVPFNHRLIGLRRDGKLLVITLEGHMAPTHDQYYPTRPDRFAVDKVKAQVVSAYDAFLFAHSVTHDHSCHWKELWSRLGFEFMALVQQREEGLREMQRARDLFEFENHVYYRGQGVR
ncbi:MAG: hypothetical protein Q7R83_04835 [bacterium]|nr:hypothetical protein [bacterium]